MITTYTVACTSCSAGLETTALPATCPMCGRDMEIRGVYFSKELAA